MELALIGFPQSGKKTLLSALTRSRVESGTSGSSRQEVQAGVAKLADPRLGTLAEIFQPDKLVPAEIKFLAVSSVPAAGGEAAGISGQSLNLLQGADALVHVVRAFDGPSVTSDVAEMSGKLVLSDLGILERRLERIEENLKGAVGHERDVLQREGTLVERIREGLDRGVPVREQKVSTDEAGTLANYQPLTGKPMLIVLNQSEDDPPRSQGGPDAQLEGPGVRATSVCVKLEMELTQLSAEEEGQFRESMGLEDPGVDRVIRMSYELLSLMSFFTHVSKEVRAWTVQSDTSAAKAAGKIHSDMERGFIRAEVTSFEDLARCRSIAQCKKEGVVRVEGKGYPVKDGDVITFLFNV